MAFKQYIVFGLLIAGLFSSTRNNQVPDYMSNYEGRITEALLDLEQCVNLTKSNPSREELLAATYRVRLSMKSADFWLRYLEPLAYKKINGPLPIEWEVEVFEKWEKPYKRIGSGLTLAEAYLEEDNWSADSLAWYYKQASKSLNIFIADSLTKSIES
jgi:cytochrome c peroxidase